MGFVKAKKRSLSKKKPAKKTQKAAGRKAKTAAASSKKAAVKRRIRNSKTPLPKSVLKSSPALPRQMIYSNFSKAPFEPAIENPHVKQREHDQVLSALSKFTMRENFDSAANALPVMPSHTAVIVQPPQASVTHAKRNVDRDDIPSRYNATFLTLLARDPSFIHAYWELSSKSIAELRKKIGAVYGRSVWTLRMYDVTLKDFDGRNANHWFDIDVGLNINSWYIHLWRDNVAYCGEIGVRTVDGRFFPAIRSNFVTAPRRTPSPRHDLIWMKPKLTSSTVSSHGSASTQIKAWVEVKDAHMAKAANQIARYLGRGKKFLPSRPMAFSLGKSPRRIFLSREDIRAYYSRLSPLLAARGIKSKRRRTTIWNRLWDGARCDFDLDDIFHGGITQTKIFTYLFQGSSAQGGGSEQHLGIPAASAQLASESPRAGKFFFEIGTELIVYGRTEPDAAVKLNGNNVLLRPDGTFTLRFSLPDGKIPLDFIAESADHSAHRTIVTSVERSKTAYAD